MARPSISDVAQAYWKESLHNRVYNHFGLISDANFKRNSGFSTTLPLYQNQTQLRKLLEQVWNQSAQIKSRMDNADYAVWDILKGEPIQGSCFVVTAPSRNDGHPFRFRSQAKAPSGEYERLPEMTNKESRLLYSW